MKRVKTSACTFVRRKWTYDDSDAFTVSFLIVISGLFARNKPPFPQVADSYEKIAINALSTAANFRDANNECGERRWTRQSMSGTLRALRGDAPAP